MSSRMLSFDNLLGKLASGKVLFDKKTYISSVSGSAQVIVPVKPVCPKLLEDTQPHVGPADEI